ncbi:substrate-binding domain-containing protein [Pelagibius litoralis]|uniref:Substrate-binding domain-containing protein n=1 Tax=Pelagibius litoralis TaxID=374515 RepID=A0A967F0H8_9PROT|nr:LacI family DNA-binding transcriptional regulator [Pelagibius litoralis]NIA70822.1 substrate-binding domain-containing protein [Pelagibius litoralis]
MSRKKEDGKETARAPSAKTGRKQPTSYDVARLAGVSQSAVSRAFSNNGYVSPEARKKITAAAVQLGFRPNALARGLITRRSRLVGVVVADLYYSFYVSILHQLSGALRASGFHALLFSIPSSENIDAMITDVLAYQVDGVIMSSARLSSRAPGLCRDAGVPVVTMNRIVDDSSISAVATDNRGAGRMVGEFLQAGGHRRFGFIAGLDDSSTSRDREAGFRDALAQAPAVAQGGFTYDGGHRAALDLMLGANPPDAIFCASDIMAMGALDALRFDLGLTPGEDVSVVGFNNAAEAAWRTYDLTSVTASAEELSQRAVEILAELIEDPDLAPQREFLPGQLVLRSSARMPENWPLDGGGNVAAAAGDIKDS